MWNLAAIERKMRNTTADPGPIYTPSTTLPLPETYAETNYEPNSGVSTCYVEYR